MARDEDDKNKGSASSRTPLAKEEDEGLEPSPSAQVKDDPQNEQTQVLDATVRLEGEGAEAKSEDKAQEAKAEDNGGDIVKDTLIVLFTSWRILRVSFGCFNVRLAP